MFTRLLLEEDQKHDRCPSSGSKVHVQARVSCRYRKQGFPLFTDMEGSRYIVRGKCKVQKVWRDAVAQSNSQ